MSQFDQRHSLPERVASGELTFLRNINDSPWAEYDDELYMMNLVARVGRDCLVLGATMAPDGAFGTREGTGVYMLTVIHNRLLAES